MSNVVEIKKNELEVWEQKEQIRKIFAPNLSTTEFEYFCSLGKALNANPFTREIWAVKYDSKQPAQIFCGRDFYRKKAQELPNYNGHIVDAVYENDKFTVENGKPKHTYSLSNRGKLIGAYCVVYRKDTANPYFVYVDFNEYNKGFSNWKSMPATMIKKVAEAQALRGAFQGVFAGTYDESEKWIENNETTTEEITEVEVIQSEPEVEPDEELVKEIEELKKAGLEFEIKDGFIGIKNGYSHRNLLASLGYKFSKEKRIYYKRIA